MRAKVRFNQAQKNTVQYYTISEESGEARIGDIAPLDMPNKKRRVVVSSYRPLANTAKSSQNFGRVFRFLRRPSPVTASGTIPGQPRRFPTEEDNYQ
jgi:hypothetical protein